MATILYRACRISDLAGFFSGLFNYGLANHRGTNVLADFNADGSGYRTGAISTTLDPLVAFTYACMSASPQNNVAVFAIRVENDRLRRGSVQLQAQGVGVAAGTATYKSVHAQHEIVLEEVNRSDILGYYSVSVQGEILDLGRWTDVSGTAEWRNLARSMIHMAVANFKRLLGEPIKKSKCMEEIERLMGH